MKFEARNLMGAERRLMLNFDEFNISDPRVVLRIHGTSSSEVRLVQCFIVYTFHFINQLSFNILKYQIKLFLPFHTRTVQYRDTG